MVRFMSITGPYKWCDLCAYSPGLVNGAIMCLLTKPYKRRDLYAHSLYLINGGIRCLLIEPYK